MNNKLIIFLVFLVFVSTAAVSAAEDVNQTVCESNFDVSDSGSDSLAVQQESLSAGEDVGQKDFEGCSFVIQEEDETVFAFRQDSAPDGQGVVIHNESLGEMEVIVQEMDAPNNHFIHAIITEDGWIASHGGDSSNVSSTIAVEDFAFEMLGDKDILQESLINIRDILKTSGCGHFLIKAPDGRYAVVFSDVFIIGTLNPGEFLSVPNSFGGFRKGNYSDYAIGPVDAIVELCSYDSGGFERCNIYIYDYKAHRTANGEKYGVDVYVANDNGRYVGLDTSGIVCYCSFNGMRYQPSAIPQTPDRLQIASHIFEGQSIGSHIEIVSSQNIVRVGESSPVRYRICNIADDRTVVFELEGIAEFDNAVAFQGIWSYDSTRQKLYWDLPVADTSKEIILSVRAKDKGFYKISAHIEGIDGDAELIVYATDDAAIITAENVTTYKTLYRSMGIYLTDEAGVPYIGGKVSITIDGTTYWREVTPKGYAGFAVMLQPGEYDAVISYAAGGFKSQTTSKIIVMKTLFGENLEVSYGSASAFEVSCLDENGAALAESKVGFYIDGVMRSGITDSQGICSLNLTGLDLGIGNHSITTYNLRTNEFTTNWINVIDPKTQLAANPVTATYNVGKNLVITLKDSTGKAISGADVTVNLNGAKSYTTDKNGQVKVNVANLVPKTYTAVITFAGNDKYASSSANAKVTVKKANAKMVAKKKTFKAKSKSKKYTVALKDSRGKAIAKAKVTLKLKGKKVISAKTGANGKATFKIALSKKGTYAAVIRFAGDKCYNAVKSKVKITVK